MGLSSTKNNENVSALRPQKSGRGLRILVLTSTYPSPNSTHQAAFLHRLAMQLSQSGFSVTVFTRRHITLGSYISSWSRVREYYSEPSVFEYSLDNLPVYGIRLHLLLPLYYSRSAARLTYRALKPKIVQLHKKMPFDVIHLAGWGDFSLAGAWISKDLGIPYIASAIGGYVNKYYNKPGSVPYDTMREYFLGSRKVMCVSEDLRGKVGLITEDKARTFVFHSGVDRDLFHRDAHRGQQIRMQLGVDKESVLILTVGRIGPEKGIGELVEAFSLLREKHPKATLVLLGPVARPTWLKKLLCKFDLRTTVIVVGSQDSIQIPQYLSAADIFAFPSWMEGLPNSVIEACACGAAVVATRVGGIPEIVEDGVSGLLVEPRSVDDLCVKLDRLLSDSHLRVALAKAAEERVARLFDHDYNAADLAAEFCEVAGI